MSVAKRKIVLKKLKEHNTIWHPESTLVFKSQKERLVIGRYVDGNLIQLDDTAIDLCDEYEFKPDESLFETMSGEDNSDENPTPSKNTDNDEEETQGSGDEGMEQGDDGNEENETRGSDDDMEQEEKEESEDQEEQEEKKESVANNIENKTYETSVDILEKDNQQYCDKENILESKGECFPIIDMCHNLLQEVTQKETKLKNFLVDLQGSLDSERELSHNLSLELNMTKEKLVSTEDELSSLQAKYDVIKQKFDTMKSIFA